MAIQEITDTELVQRCAKCDRENRVVLANLEVGVERDDQVEDSVVPLPECPTCRSREFLLRSPARSRRIRAQGSSGHLHRLLVDELHSELVKKGRVVARLKRQDGRGLHRPSPPRSSSASSTRGSSCRRAPSRTAPGKEPGQ
jgi:DNA-directed RNA polymerase subunit RPC12/RpoP